MKVKTAAIGLAALVSGPLLVPQAAQARHYSHHRHVVYSRERCSGGNGAVGTVAGGVGGALIGNAVGGGTLGTVAGGVGGALLGRHLTKQLQISARLPGTRADHCAHRTKIARCLWRKQRETPGYGATMYCVSRRLGLQLR
jgi:uncharacterized protein YcfJ